MASKQILIVEDEKPIRDMIAFGLRRAGAHDARAVDGARLSRADAWRIVPGVMPARASLSESVPPAQGQRT